MGTTSTILIPENVKRVGLIVSSPMLTSAPSPANTTVTGVSCATGGVKLSYTQPPGTNGIMTFASAVQTNPANAGLVLRYTPFSGTPTQLINLQATGIAISIATSLPLGPGDVLDWFVYSVGAGSTYDLDISVVAQPSNSRITLAFNGPAILDSGITINAGTSPVSLFQEFIGTGLRESVWAIGSLAGTKVGFVELMHP